MEPRAQVLKSAFDIAHMVLNAVIADLDDQAAAFKVAGGTVPSAGAILAHCLHGEDMMVSQAAGGTKLTLLSEGFQARTGIAVPAPAMTPEWHSQAFNVAGLKEYGAAVFARTNAFLEGASSSDLDRLIDTPLGSKVPAADYLASFGVVHLSEHTGEISALKGAQGGRGLPF